MARASNKESVELVPVGGVSAASTDPADDLKNIEESVLTASMVTGENALVIGPVGGGKTEIMLRAAQQAFGEDGTLKLECTPSTPESRIMGYPNPALMIDPDAAKRGVEEFIVRHTPLDPRVRVVILDEWQRLSDLGQDALVHVMHNVGMKHRPLFWGTSNWTMTNVRTEAVRDRFALTVFYQPPAMDVVAIMRKPPIMQWDFNLPDAADAQAIRETLDKPIPEKSFKAIAEVITEINRIVNSDTMFNINNRRVKQWQNLLYATAFYATGSPEFKVLPELSIDVLGYAYPVITLEEAVHWRRIVSKVSDAAATQIAEFEANAYEQWKSIIEQFGARHSSREELVRSLGSLLAEAQEELNSKWPDDPRAKKSASRMSEWYRRVARGESLG